MTIRVVVADDHLVVRMGLRCLFADAGIEIVGEANDGEASVEVILEHAPDVALIDVRLPPTDGLDVLEKVRAQSAEQKVVMLSTFDNPTYVARSIALGANDYVLKGASRHSLIESIERVARGDEPSDSSLWRHVRGSMARRREKSEGVPLTTRELQVLRHLALGLSNREIGRSLEISIETVKEHVQNVLRKISAGDRTQAAVWAVRKQLV